MDVWKIEMYEREGIYPMHGESCVTFMRDCEYINTCTLSTEYLAKPCTEKDQDKVEYSVELTMADLIQSQLEKVES
jgi:hypothetical protein